MLENNKDYYYDSIIEKDIAGKPIEHHFSHNSYLIDLSIDEDKETKQFVFVKDLKTNLTSLKNELNKAFSFKLYEYIDEEIIYLLNEIYNNDLLKEKEYYFESFSFKYNKNNINSLNQLYEVGRKLSKKFNIDLNIKIKLAPIEKIITYNTNIIGCKRDDNLLVKYLDDTNQVVSTNLLKGEK